MGDYLDTLAEFVAETKYRDLSPGGGCCGQECDSGYGRCHSRGQPSA